MRVSVSNGGLRECGATYGLFCLGECALVAGDCGVITGLEPVVRVENFLLALLCDLTPCRSRRNCTVGSFWLLTCSMSDPICFRMRCFLLRLTSTLLPVSGAHSKCAGLTFRGGANAICRKNTCVLKYGIARWAQSKTRHGYPKLVRVII